jgi:hypothetical protein
LVTGPLDIVPTAREGGAGDAAVAAVVGGNGAKQ